MSGSGKDQSVFAEDFSPQPGRTTGSLFAEPALTGHVAAQDPNEAALVSVWDEPGIKDSVQRPPDAPTYASWYGERLARTSIMHSWLVVIGLAIIGGPFAILGAISSFNSGTMVGLLAVVVVGPMLEEFLKAGATMITLERHPYLFRYVWQIPLAVAGSALGFATVENLLYLGLYIDQPSASIVLWRWTVCTALHVGCSLIAGMGLMRMLRQARVEGAPPRTAAAFPYIVAAITVHGAYNLLATLTEVILEPF